MHGSLKRRFPAKPGASIISPWSISRLEMARRPYPTWRKRWSLRRILRCPEQLGGEYVRSGRYRDAEAMLDRARNLNPNDPLPLTNLGILYLKQGERLEFVAAVKADSGSDGPLIFYDKAVEVFKKLSD